MFSIGGRRGRQERARSRRWAAFCLVYAVAALVPLAGYGPALAGDASESSIFTRKTLTDAPQGPKEKLRDIGVTPEVWVTQFYQGLVGGDEAGVSRYGGKVDGFLSLQPERLGLLPGLRVDAQYEHYFGENINVEDDALVPVNTAQAYLRPHSYHSTLSLLVTQKFNENISVSTGKFNMMTLAARTPLIGGGGLTTFMNRAFALPSTGVAYTSSRGGAGDRVVLSPPYLLGSVTTIKSDALKLDLLVADPRSAINPRVIEHPFEKGVQVAAAVTLETKIAGLLGYHTVRGAYSNARGVDLDDVTSFRANNLALTSPLTKKGYWFTSYAMQQYLFQKSDDPKIGWGLFTLATLSDGNPNPIKWSILVGLAGNNLYAGRENDRWGIGFYHFGLSEALISGLAELGDPRTSEGGVEAFYNLELMPWCYLSADVQVIQPWNPKKQQEEIVALRLQTKF